MDELLGFIGLCFLVYGGYHYYSHGSLPPRFHLYFFCFLLLGSIILSLKKRFLPSPTPTPTPTLDLSAHVQEALAGLYSVDVNSVTDRAEVTGARITLLNSRKQWADLLKKLPAHEKAAAQVQDLLEHIDRVVLTLDARIIELASDGKTSQPHGDNREEARGTRQIPEERVTDSSTSRPQIASDRRGRNDQSSIRIAAEELLHIDENKRLLSIAWRMLWAPVRTAISLSLNPNFRRHVAILGIGVAVSLLAIDIVPDAFQPEVLRETPLPADADELTRKAAAFFSAYQSLIASLLLYAVFAFTFIVGYRMYYRRAMKLRTRKQFFRLSTIAYAYTSFLQLFSTTPALAYRLWLLPEFEAHVGYAALRLLYICALTFYYFRVTRVFWGIPFWPNFYVSTIAGFAGVLLAVALWFPLVMLGYTLAALIR